MTLLFFRRLLSLKNIVFFLFLGETLSDVYNRLVHFFYFFELSMGAFDTKYLGPNQVKPQKKLGLIISQKTQHDKPKVYLVTVCTDEGGKTQVFSTYLVKMVR